MTAPANSKPSYASNATHKLKTHVYLGSGYEVIGAKIVIEYDQGVLSDDEAKRFLDEWGSEAAKCISTNLNKIKEV